MADDAGQSIACVFFAGVVTDFILRVDGDGFGNQDLGWIAVTEARRALLDEVIAQEGFGDVNVASASACASFDLSVTDAPDRRFDRSVGTLPGRLEPETRPFGTTRHSFLISSMAASVV